MQYAIVIEKPNGNYSVYAPDVPGCAATGATLEQVKQQIQEGLTFHYEGLQHRLQAGRSEFDDCGDIKLGTPETSTDSKFIPVPFSR